MRSYITSARRRSRAGRRGAAAVEAAAVAPILVFLVATGVDFARVLQLDATLTNAARSGAMYGSQDSEHMGDTSGIQVTALADLEGYSPTPAVATTSGYDDAGRYVEVSVSQPFSTYTRVPGFNATFTLTRKVRMRVTPDAPNEPSY